MRLMILRIDADGRCTSLCLWHGPVATAEALLNRDAVGMDAAPLQADKFTDPQSSPHAHVEHRGVRLGNELHSVAELLGRDGWLGLSCPLVQGQP